MRGRWPIATKTPSTGSSDSVPSTVDTSVSPVTFSSPLTEATVAFQAKSILGSATARSAMAFEARSASRRCTTVTLSAKRVRKVASSMAESPPPMTAMSLSRKKKPSQVAQ